MPVKATRTVDRAFQSVEIYDILMEQLVAAIQKYDPDYKIKVKQVVGVIQREFCRRKQFTLAEVNRHLEFDGDRYLRLLWRRGFLQAVKGGKNGKISGYRFASWPPPPEFIGSDPSGRHRKGTRSLAEDSLDAHSRAVGSDTGLIDRALDVVSFFRKV